MCIRFLLEGNLENQRIVRELEARGVANGEDLEREYGVKADVDVHGKVKVEQRARRKEVDESTGQKDHERYQNFLAQDRILSQQKGFNGRQADYDQFGDELSSEVAAEYRSTVQSRPVRRASDSVAAAASLSSLGQTTAERIASMTERFNKLDISRFAQGLPIRSTNTVQHGNTTTVTSTTTTIPANFATPISGSRVIEELTDNETDTEDASPHDGHAENSDEPRLLDVGDML